MDAGTAAAITRRIDALHAREDPAVETFFDASTRPERLAVLPSAFNPPTDAHLAMLRLASRTLAATPAALLTTRNVAKGIEGAPLGDRVAMLMAARASEPGLAVLVANVARFVDQAQALRTHLPGATIDFVAGYDTLVRIFDPRYYEDMERELATFFASHRLFVSNRAGSGTEDVSGFIEEHASEHAGAIHVFELPEREASLSSTAARETATGAIHGVPQPVRDYIRAHGLYAPRLTQ